MRFDEKDETFLKYITHIVYRHHYNDFLKKLGDVEVIINVIFLNEIKLMAIIVLYHRTPLLNSYNINNKKSKDYKKS